MAEFINRLNKLTVPELWNELHTYPHTVVDQYIIKELIKKKYQAELICQAQKNFKKANNFAGPMQACPRKNMPGILIGGADLANEDGCTIGRDPSSIIKDNDNQSCLFDCNEAKSQIIFDASDFQRSEYSNPDMNEADTNDQLNNRFMDDIRTISGIHSKTKNKPIIQSPYI
jgi:hypothetical protein